MSKTTEDLLTERILDYLCDRYKSGSLTPKRFMAMILLTNSFDGEMAALIKQMNDLINGRLEA